jgi:hypothetical protein
MQLDMRVLRSEALHGEKVRPQGGKKATDLRRQVLRWDCGGPPKAFGSVPFRGLVAGNHDATVRLQRVSEHSKLSKVLVNKESKHSAGCRQRHRHTRRQIRRFRQLTDCGSALTLLPDVFAVGGKVQKVRKRARLDDRVPGRPEPQTSGCPNHEQRRWRQRTEDVVWLCEQLGGAWAGLPLPVRCGFAWLVFGIASLIPVPRAALPVVHDLLKRVGSIEFGH